MLLLLLVTKVTIQTNRAKAIVIAYTVSRVATLLFINISLKSEVKR